MSSYRNHPRSESDDPEDEVSLSDLDDRDAFDDDALRQARIDEYREESLRRDDPQTAILGAITAGLTEMLFRHEDAIKGLLAGDAGLIYENRELQRAMSMYLNTARQVDRNVNLVTRLESSREAAKHSGVGRRSSAKNLMAR